MKTTEIQRINAALGTSYTNLDDETWDDISAYQKLTPAFIKKHAGQVNWDLISASQHLTEAFIEKYAEQADWNSI